MLERPIHELCVLADDAYRRSAHENGTKLRKDPRGKASDTVLRDVGIALKAALIDDRSLVQFQSAIETLRTRHPDLAKQLDL
jgi:hypothetical protein